MSRMQHVTRALRHRDFRIFFIGQGLSVTGTWMQTVAQSWLIYRLTGSPFALGVLAVARFGPSLIGSPIAGVLTDRMPRLRLVRLTQAASMAQAAVLAALTLAGAVEVWHVLALALFQGLVDTLDMPARQTLQVDLVGVEDLQSAVSLNSSAFNAARMVGPAIAGHIVATLGEGICFAVNAASYLAVLLALAAIRVPSVQRSGRASVLAELGEGFAYAYREPRTRRVLAAVAVTSVFGLAYSTLLPVLAREALGRGAEGYGALLAGAGLGAIVGALAAAAVRAGGERLLIPAGQAGLGLSMLALATARSLPFAVACMVVIGFALAIQLSTTNAFVQTTAPPALRGRVVSLYIWMFAGLSPLGGLAAGWVAERLGAAMTAAGAGVLCLSSALVLAALPRGDGRGETR